MGRVSSNLVNNRHLFSNYYLENQIDALPEWIGDEHLAAFRAIEAIYERERPYLDNLNESQLEERFFREIFRLLLPHYEVQGATLGSEFPDYAFFPSQEAQDEAQIHKNTESFFKEAYAVGEVKRWDVELDRFGKNRHDKRRNPSFQIWLYIHETEPAWGILSNGRKWRLYHQDKPLDIYYEVDLVAMLEAGDPEAFRYFYYFFCRQAFVPNKRGEVFLDLVLEGSATYAQEIGENLKENVYRAMKKIAEGFFSWSENGLDPSDPEARARVQKNTMILLYRFLFLLYAEGKSLLDLRDAQYRESYSFDRIKKEVSEREDDPQKGRYLPIRTSLWGSLKDMFRLIDKGSRELGIDDQIHVPAYNGGLFDPARHPLLEKWTIGDTYLASAVDLLSRSVKDGQKGFVDYSTLEIRHLGSIYEGLLEYRLEVAEGDLVVAGGKDRRWVSIDELNGSRKKKASFDEFGEFDRASKGQLYLTTDRGERKATGSYYTPDYIVDYIVENTVGPVVEERWTKALMEGTSMIEATRSVKVLDPAMGSGHFLVGAVEFLAGKLMEAAERDIEWEIVQDEGQFTNEWAKREAVSHCIYGVDLNELAVELAKVSLWLRTIAREKPLSFLDHRLKQGNSLVGARLSDLKHFPGVNSVPKDQATLPSFVSPLFVRHLIGKIKELDEIGDNSLSEIKRKEEVFEEFKSLPEYTKAKAIANVHTAVYFGVVVEPTANKSADMVYHDLFWGVAGDEAEWRRKTRGDWFDKAQGMAESRSFFHWELEFPEIFFEGGDVKGNPGWDAVVGNPPYVRQEVLGDLKGYFEGSYKIYHGVADLYVYFVERGLSFLKIDGQFSYIMANKWIRANYGQPLRSWLRDRRIEVIVDFGDLPVFPEATTYPCIIRISGGPPRKRFLAAEVKALDFEDLGEYVDENAFFVRLAELDDGGWSLANEAVQKLLEKLRRAGEPLGEYVKGKIYYGIKTGLNEAFVIDEATKKRLVAEDPKSVELIKPFLAGRDIKRYEPPESDRYLIFTRRGVEIERYPAIEKYLLQFKDRLTPKPANDEGNNSIGRKPGSYKWYEIQDTIDYYTDFEKSKIFWPEIAGSARFTIDSNGFYANNKAYIIPEASKYLLAILNSSLVRLFIHNSCTDLQGNSFNFSAIFIEKSPIRRITFSTPEDERSRQVSELKDLYAANEIEQILRRVDGCLPKDAEGEFLPGKDDVVHDLLAFLAEEMTEMNKRKQDQIKGFLRWLETETGARVEDLSNKTKVKAYYDGDAESLVEILKKNKRRLSEDPSRRKFQEALRREFDDSKEILSPLIARIEETDRLIDQVVYRLYGLTEEEIAIVEAGASGVASRGRAGGDP